MLCKIDSVTFRGVARNYWEGNSKSLKISANQEGFGMQNNWSSIFGILFNEISLTPACRF